MVTRTVLSRWSLSGNFFLLHCCAHPDDGDSLGNGDELVHPICIKQENQSTDKTTRKLPHQKNQTQTKHTNNQNTGNPKEGESWSLSGKSPNVLSSTCGWPCERSCRYLPRSLHVLLSRASYLLFWSFSDTSDDQTRRNVRTWWKW